MAEIFLKYMKDKVTDPRSSSTLSWINTKRIPPSHTLVNCCNLKKKERGERQSK